MHLAPHTRANKDFFEPGSRPSIHTWCDWIRSGAIRGKIINGKPYIDLNHFAAHDELEPPSVPLSEQSGRALLE